MGARLLYGHKYMDYGSFVPWGLWVAFDLFFLGLTAGAYIVTILVYGFRVKLFAALGPLSVFALLVTLLCEGIIISLDLGHPFRVYRFLITPNFGSMLFWLVAFIIAMWAIYLPTFFLLLREQFIAWSHDEQREGKSMGSWSEVEPLIPRRIANAITAGCAFCPSSVFPWACCSLGFMALCLRFC